MRKTLSLSLRSPPLQCHSCPNGAGRQANERATSRASLASQMFQKTAQSRDGSWQTIIIGKNQGIPQLELAVAPSKALRWLLLNELEGKEKRIVSYLVFPSDKLPDHHVHEESAVPKQLCFLGSSPESASRTKQNKNLHENPKIS